jgi:hypothetical protein
MLGIQILTTKIGKISFRQILYFFHSFFGQGGLNGVFCDSKIEILSFFVSFLVDRLHMDCSTKIWLVGVVHDLNGSQLISSKFVALNFDAISARNRNIENFLSFMEDLNPEYRSLNLNFSNDLGQLN